MDKTYQFSLKGQIVVPQNLQVKEDADGVIMGFVDSNGNEFFPILGIEIHSTSSVQGLTTDAELEKHGLQIINYDELFFVEP